MGRGWAQKHVIMRSVKEHIVTAAAAKQCFSRFHWSTKTLRELHQTDRHRNQRKEKEVTHVGIISFIFYKNIAQKIWIYRE